jgi:phage replication-related protein YjqB (UPF0714/DUF867 family)
MDEYRDFQHLKEAETEGIDFRVRTRDVPGATAVIAPHGGGIEPGTSEIADAVAGVEHSFFSFEGVKNSGNRRLHITSTHFDEPRCLALARAASQVLAIHGEDSDDEAIFIGGRNHRMRNA